MVRQRPLTANSPSTTTASFAMLLAPMNSLSCWMMAKDARDARDARDDNDDNDDDDDDDDNVVTLKVVPRRLLQKVVPRLGRAAAT
jgi:hypothetical protein